MLDYFFKNADKYLFVIYEYRLLKKASKCFFQQSAMLKNPIIENRNTVLYICGHFLDTQLVQVWFLASLEI